MSIEHDFFGLVGGETDSWSERVEFGDQSVDVRLRSDEDAPDEEALDIAAGMVSTLEQLDADVREDLVGQLSSSGSPTSLFVVTIVAALDPETIRNSVDRESGDQAIDILRSLELLSTEFTPEHNGRDEPFVVLEYAFAPDEVDAMLSVSVDSNGDVVEVLFLE